MKTTTGITPGPWKYHKGRGVDPRFHIQTVGGFQIAETPKNGIACGRDDVNEANARAIAALPKLIEALQAIDEFTCVSLCLFASLNKMELAGVVIRIRETARRELASLEGGDK